MAVAALLPCFWIYWEVGKHLLGTAGPDNPYQSWIDIYADEAFADGVRKAIAISDQIADAASAPVRDRIRRIRARGSARVDVLGQRVSAGALAGLIEAHPSGIRPSVLDTFA
jgi:hypothetical protein